MDFTDVDSMLDDMVDLMDCLDDTGFGESVARDGNLLLVVIVKSWVNKQAGSWLAAQQWTTNQMPGQQVDQTLDNDYNS